jgi:hypothetical protein
MKTLANGKAEIGHGDHMRAILKPCLAISAVSFKLRAREEELRVVRMRVLAHTRTRNRQITALTA